MHPFRQARNGSTIRRTFNASVDSSDLIWHRDKHERSVTVVESNGWQLQFDGQLPIPLVEGNTYTIPEKSWHRVIKGRGQLKITIKENHMAIKLTETRLRQIIKEETQRLLEYEQILFRKNGKTYLGNDEGEEDYFDSDPESHGLYNDGDSVPYEGRGRGGYGGGYSDNSWTRGGGYSRYGRSSYGRRRY